MRKLLLFSLLCMLLPVAAAAAPEGACDGVTVGAADTAAYFPLLRGRRVATRLRAWATSIWSTCCIAAACA